MKALTRSLASMLAALLAAEALLPHAALQAAPAVGAFQEPQEPDRARFRFKAGVDLINVTATVTDANGRFVSGLRQDDFRVYEDDVVQPVSHFSAERVPVSLGIVLDTSGSMEGDKIRAARTALDRLLAELNDPNDEFFLYQFASDATLLQPWTGDRRAVSRALGRTRPLGDTAMYDAIALAVPLAAQGRNRKKALIVISDGNDTSSTTRIGDLRRMIRESEVLVYAIGIDGESAMPVPSTAPVPPRTPTPFPTPFPRPRRPLRNQLLDQWPQWPPRPRLPSRPRDDGVNDVALREMTDDSGGRTEIVRGARDLEPATSGIAAELSRQYYLGYSAPGARDGRWHAIRVELPAREHRQYRVRARRGYVAG